MFGKKLGFKICVLFLFISFSGMSQDEPPEDQVPVDGGITILITLAAAWGIRKIRNEGK